MNILALNTAFNQSYVAVKTENKTILENMDSSLKQSENILGLIDTALNKAEIELSCIDAIACVIGPGSFTGIRIGASLAKGFCSNKEHIKRIPINSLDLLAYTLSKTKPNQDFWVVLNALSGNFFACMYSKNGEKLQEAELISDNIAKISGLVVGLYEEGLDICNCYVALSSSDLIEYSIFKANNQKENLDFTPLYLRKSQAEAELDKKNGNN